MEDGEDGRVYSVELQHGAQREQPATRCTAELLHLQHFASDGHYVVFYETDNSWESFNLPDDELIFAAPGRPGEHRMFVSSSMLPPGHTCPFVSVRGGAILQKGAH